MSTTKHISGEYENELNSLKSDFSHLGGLVETQLQNAVQAFIKNESNLGLQVRETELEINRCAMEMDRKATYVIARRQPAAADLRFIVSILKNSTDLERIGDESERIAKFSDSSHVYDPSYPYHGDLTELCGRVSKALQTALDVFARLDVDASLTAIASDRQVDRLYDDVVGKATQQMMKNPSRLTHDLAIIWVARSLERISDHAKNICETVVYLVHGQQVVHNVNVN